GREQLDAVDLPCVVQPLEVAEDPQPDAVRGRQAGTADHRLDPPLGATAVEGHGDGQGLLLRVGSRLASRRLADLVPDHLAAGVRAADRADAMREARAVAPRTLVEARRADRVSRAPLIAACARGSLLRD